jgi:hypothetical protein
MKLAYLLSRVLPAGRENGAFAAVTVPRVIECCEAARDTTEHPILLSSQPRLPLPNCSMPERCVCRFRVWPDRRIGDRRLEGTQADDPSGNGKRRKQERRRG